MISLKKLLATALSAAMVLGTMAIPAFADESASENAAKIGETEYATLQEAFDAAQKDDTITLLNDITLTKTVNVKTGSEALKGITFDGNGKTISYNFDENTSAFNFEKYPSGINIKDLTMTGTAKYGIYFTGGGSSNLTNVNISGSYFYTVAFYGTHGATLTDCNIENSNDGKSTVLSNGYSYPNSAVWTNVSYLTPINLINSKVSSININGYVAGKNVFAPKIYVNETSETKIFCFQSSYKDTENNISVVPNKLYCLDPASTGNVTVQELIDDNPETLSKPIAPVAKADVTVDKVSQGKITGSFDATLLFDSLAGAVAAVKDGGTVTLLGDAEGDGIFIGDNKTVTVDFGGYTYTVNGTLVGSNKSETNCFQFLKGTTVTFKNGTIISSADAKWGSTTENEDKTTGANIIFQNYSNLTLDNITIDYTKDIEGANPGRFFSYDVISSNYGDTVLNNVNILKAGNGPAVDIMHWETSQPYIDKAPTLTINNSDENVITGKFDVYCYNNGNHYDKACRPVALIYGGTFTTDVSNYVAKGYMSKDNGDGTYTVVPATATVNDTAKSSGVTVTLDELHQNGGIDLDKDVTYSVVLDTVKSDDKAAVDEIKNANPNKTVIAYDIYVEKTEDGVKSEVDGVTNQKVTLKLPTKVKEGGEVKVYHNGTEISGVILSEDRMSVSFIAPSFSAYTFVYDADSLTDTEITKNIKVEFEKVTDSEYDIVLKATDPGTKINGLLTADLTFSLTQGTTGLVNYEITPAANMSLLVNGNRYTFSFDGTNAHSATGDEIVIGKVVFDGYCTGAKFNVVDTATTNLVNTTKAVDSIVEYYVINGDGTNTGTLNATASIDDINLTQETADLTVKVSFPNAVKNNVAAYQDMKVSVSGNGANEVVELGSDNSNVSFANDTYTVNFSDMLVKGGSYTVTVEGAGYRTARYTVSMTGNKTLNFWNNVKDTLTFVEEGVGTGVNSNFLAGDIVKDGQINIYDLSAVISYFGTDNLVTDHPTYAKYDLNRDGVIDSKDVAYVLVSWGK